MRIRVLLRAINLSMMIAFLSSLTMSVMCQIGGGWIRGPANSTALTVVKQHLGHPLADDQFIPSDLATPTQIIRATPTNTPAPLRQPLTAVAWSPPVTVITTDTRFVGTSQFGTSTGIATDVGRAETTPAPLLDSLARNRPSMWGSKWFYALLGVLYLALLCLFVKQILSLFKRQP